MIFMYAQRESYNDIWNDQCHEDQLKGSRKYFKICSILMKDKPYVKRDKKRHIYHFS